MNILAFESSCDETAVAVVRDGRQVLSDAILSQADMHALYGGVVPEIASRKHVEAIAGLTDQALAEAGVGRSDIDAVAVTYGPGLIGALLVGVNFAKSAACALGKPLIPVHHQKYNVRLWIVHMVIEDDGYFYSSFAQIITREFCCFMEIVQKSIIIRHIRDSPITHHRVDHGFVLFSCGIENNASEQIRRTHLRLEKGHVINAHLEKSLGIADSAFRTISVHNHDFDATIETKTSRF